MPTYNKTERQAQEYKQKIETLAKYEMLLHKAKSQRLNSTADVNMASFYRQKIRNINKLLFYT